MALIASSCGEAVSDSTILPGWPRADLIELFFVEEASPGEYQTLSVSTQDGGIEVHDISFVGSDPDRMVRAFLVVPQAEGPHAGVLFLHQGGGSRSSFLAEAVELARLGAIALLIDAPYRQVADYFVEVVRNLRFGANLLASRDDVDPSRLGYVGHSWGATFGGILGGVDGRFATYVLIAGAPSFSDLFKTDDFLPLDGGAYIGAASPASVFFQFAENDFNVPKELAQEFFRAASDPKRVEWYTTTHSFNDDNALADRTAWLADELGLP